MLANDLVPAADIAFEVAPEAVFEETNLPVVADLFNTLPFLAVVCTNP
jgi:hypothetical protein